MEDKQNEEKSQESGQSSGLVVRRKVTDWIDLGESEGKEEAIGGIGGFFNAGMIHGMRWKDYIEIWKDETKPYAEAIRKNVIENNIKITGEKHQSSSNGVPLFDDGKIGSFSYRAWGDLMAAIWSEEESKDYNYMNFYM